MSASPLLHDGSSNGDAEFSSSSPVAANGMNIQQEDGAGEGGQYDHKKVAQFIGESIDLCCASARGPACLLEKRSLAF